jgi:hypothetical protein
VYKFIKKCRWVIFFLLVISPSIMDKILKSFLLNEWVVFSTLTLVTAIVAYCSHKILEETKFKKYFKKTDFVNRRIVFYYKDHLKINPKATIINDYGRELIASFEYRENHDIALTTLEGLEFDGCCIIA